MEKGEGGNRKYQQKRRRKRAKTFSGVRRQEKSAKLDDGDENMAAVIENINDFPPAGSTAASSVTSTEIDIDICTSSVTPDDRERLGYRLFDLSILKTMFSNMICPHYQTQRLYMQETSKQGLAFKYMVTCQDTFNCRWTYTFFNSPRTKKNNSQFTRSFDVNPRAIYCMRQLGKGYAGLMKPDETSTSYEWKKFQGDEGENF